MSRRLIVWRHGQTEHNAGGIYQGQLDTELSDRGREQVDAAARELASRAPSRIVASDLVRAADTARILAGLADREVGYDPRLREIDVGEWTGLTHEQVERESPETSRALARGADIARGRDGERVADVAVRTAAAAAEIVEAMGPDDLVVVATHGLAGRTLVAGLLGWSQQQAWRTLVGLRNAHWAELDEQPDGWRLVTWNAGVLTPGPPGATR
ncbi:MAG: histidine phosphatase family protein [Actinobacteria bacterium]|nr:histidine phosphatase family protein [Actinomycetota bacterium]